MTATSSQDLNFDKFAQEGYEFVNKMAEEYGHPLEEKRSLILMRSVMHAIRDRITLSESFHLMSQMPVLLRGIYAEQWHYTEKPPESYGTIEEMEVEVERNQRKFGEEDFPWGRSTADLIRITIKCLRTYLTDGQLEHVKKQMPMEVQELFQNS